MTVPAIWDLLRDDKRRLLLERFGLRGRYEARGQPPLPQMEDAEEVDKIMRQPPREGKG